MLAYHDNPAIKAEYLAAAVAVAGARGKWVTALLEVAP
jgi:hypothetical protein